VQRAANKVNAIYAVVMREDLGELDFSAVHKVLSEKK
jgi:hypothetical protein